MLSLGPRAPPARGVRRTTACGDKAVRGLGGPLAKTVVRWTLMPARETARAWKAVTGPFAGPARHPNGRLLGVEDGEESFADESFADPAKPRLLWQASTRAAAFLPRRSSARAAKLLPFAGRWGPLGRRVFLAWTVVLLGVERGGKSFAALLPTFAKG